MLKDKGPEFSSLFKSCKRAAAPSFSLEMPPSQPLVVMLFWQTGKLLLRSTASTNWVTKTQTGSSRKKEGKTQGWTWHSPLHTPLMHFQILSHMFLFFSTFKCRVENNFPYKVLRGNSVALETPTSGKILCSTHSCHSCCWTLYWIKKQSWLQFLWGHRRCLRMRVMRKAAATARISSLSLSGASLNSSMCLLLFKINPSTHL